MIALLFGEFLQDVDHFYVHFLSGFDWFNQLQKSFLIILRINSVFILKFKSLQFSTNPKFYRVYPNSFCFVFYWCYRVLPSFTGFPLNGLTLFQRHFFLHFHCSIFVPGASVSSPLACGKPPPPHKKKTKKKFHAARRSDADAGVVVGVYFRRRGADSRRQTVADDNSRRSSIFRSR